LSTNLLYQSLHHGGETATKTLTNNW